MLQTNSKSIKAIKIRFILVLNINAKTQKNIDKLNIKKDKIFSVINRLEIKVINNALKQINTNTKYDFILISVFYLVFYYGIITLKRVFSRFAKFRNVKSIFIQ